MLSWKEKEDPKASAKKPNVKPAPRKKGKEPDHQPTRSHFLNLYEDIEDADDPSETEVLKDVLDTTDAVPEPTTSGVPRAGMSRSTDSTDRSAAVQSTPATVAGDEPDVRLERLKEARRLVSV